LDRYRVPGHQRDGARASHTNGRLNQMTLYNLADYRARRLRSRAVPLHVEALAAYEQAEAYRAQHLASADVCGWGASSGSARPGARPALAPPPPPWCDLANQHPREMPGNISFLSLRAVAVLSLSSRSSRESC